MIVRCLHFSRSVLILVVNTGPYAALFSEAAGGRGWERDMRKSWGVTDRREFSSVVLLKCLLLLFLAGAVAFVCARS